MKDLTNEEQLTLFTPENQAVLVEYINAGRLLSEESQLLLFDQPQAYDLLLDYVACGHMLTNEALLKVFTLKPMAAQLFMEHCISCDMPLSTEVQLKLFELKYPRQIVKRFIRQNKETLYIAPEVYKKAKALHYI